MIMADIPYGVSRTQPVVASTTTTAIPAMIKRISWGAVFAGVVVAFIAMITLNLLGVSIGAASIDPATEVDPAAGVGTGAIIWVAASNLLALFAGGYVAGRMAGIPDNTDGVLHGLLVFAVSTLILLFSLTTTVGNALSGLGRVLGQGLSVAAQGAEVVAPEVAEALERQDISLQGIREELGGLIAANTANATGANVQQSTTTTTSPDATGTDTTGTDTAGTEGAAPSTDLLAGQPTIGMSTNPTAGERELNLVVGRMLRMGIDGVTPEERQEVVTMLSERTGISPQDAQATVDRWEAQYAEIRTEAEAVARRVGDDLAETIAAAAGIAFAAMVIGMFAAGSGGLVGSPEPEDLPVAVAERTTTLR
jgi:hypothetical protein